MASGWAVNKLYFWRGCNFFVVIFCFFFFQFDTFYAKLAGLIYLSGEQDPTNTCSLGPNTSMEGPKDVYMEGAGAVRGMVESKQRREVEGLADG